MHLSTLSATSGSDSRFDCRQRRGGMSNEGGPQPNSSITLVGSQTVQKRGGLGIARPCNSFRLAAAVISTVERTRSPTHHQRSTPANYSTISGLGAASGNTSRQCAMSTSKTPKARHVRLLSKGFFPFELLSCFFSETFGAKRDNILKEFNLIQPLKNGVPRFYAFKGERATFNFPRFGREDRRHSYINPISYFFLSKILAENYVAIRKLNRRSRMSTAPAIFDWVGERALIRPMFDARDSQRVTLNAGYELLAEADIASFFHSVYTHAIPWAIHGKAAAKQKNRT